MSDRDQPGDAWNWDSGMAPDCEVEGSIAAPIDVRGLHRIAAAQATSGTFMLSGGFEVGVDRTGAITRLLEPGGSSRGGGDGRSGGGSRA